MGEGWGQLTGNVLIVTAACRQQKPQGSSVTKNQPSAGKAWSNRLQNRYEQQLPPIHRKTHRRIEPQSKRHMERREKEREGKERRRQGQRQREADRNTDTKTQRQTP